jgi:hypothetical protein
MSDPARAATGFDDRHLVVDAGPDLLVAALLATRPRSPT